VEGAPDSAVQGATVAAVAALEPANVHCRPLPSWPSGTCIPSSLAASETDGIYPKAPGSTLPLAQQIGALDYGLFLCIDQQHDTKTYLLACLLALYCRSVPKLSVLIAIVMPKRHKTLYLAFDGLCYSQD
jgi:hypothetical protein